MSDFIKMLFNKIGLNKNEAASEPVSAETQPAEEEGEKKLTFFQKAYLVYDDILGCFYDPKRTTGGIAVFFVMIITIFCTIFTATHNPFSVSTIFLILMTICLDTGLFGLVLGKDIFEDDTLNIRIKGKRIRPEWFWPFIVYFVVLLILYALLTIGVTSFPFIG